MANVAISGLPVTTTMTDTDVLPVVATGVTSQISGADLKTYIGAGTPAGANTEIQFNDAGSFGADANLVYDNTTQTLTITGSIQANSISASEFMQANISVAQCYVEVASMIPPTNTIDATQGNFFGIEITAPTTLSVINAPIAPGPIVMSFVLEIKNGGTNVTWWPDITWPGGVAPTLSTAGTDVLAFYRVSTDDWRGFVLGLDMKV